MKALKQLAWMLVWILAAPIMMCCALAVIFWSWIEGDAGQT